jgi:hypothetical protein
LIRDLSFQVSIALVSGEQAVAQFLVFLLQTGDNMARCIVLVQSMRQFLSSLDQSLLHFHFFELEVVEAACSRLKQVGDLRGDTRWISFCGIKVEQVCFVQLSASNRTLIRNLEVLLDHRFLEYMPTNK